jgi:hypothetical protein
MADNAMTNAELLGALQELLEEATDRLLDYVEAAELSPDALDDGLLFATKVKATITRPLYGFGHTVDTYERRLRTAAVDLADA